MPLMQQETVAKSLPLVQQETDKPDDRVEATLPPALDMYSPALEHHFRGVQQHSGTIRYSTRISAEYLHMKISADGIGYIALLFTEDFMPTLPVFRPHVTLAYSVHLPDWPAWWGLKHRLTTFLNTRTITCFFARNQHAYKFVLHEDSELTVLCRIMQAEIRAAHVPVEGKNLDLCCELHMTFHQMMHHTV